ncbi:MAG: DNA-binding protein [Rhodocyclaceae bacterium]|nr:DNA-binding protein [Rhodocyclaceae bacterium]
MRYAQQTLRRSLCCDGHFHGIRPFKLPGGRLLWPADEIDDLATGKAREQAAA